MIQKVEMEDRTNPRFDYSPIRELDAALWESKGQWNNKFGRRMTIIRLKDGRIFIHNAFHLKKPDLDWLTRLGTVAFIVAPNSFHCSEAGWMKRRFPSAKLYVPKSKLRHFQEQGLDALDTETEFPDEISAELLYIPSRGTKIEEAVFLHVPSRTLILTDLAFNMGQIYSGLEKAVMELNLLCQGLGPTRALKWLFAKDRSELKAFYKELFSLDFDRVIVNHGEICDRDAKSQLKAGAVRLFGNFD